MAKKAAASVLIVGSECAPFAKTGGLADVIGTLPRDLTALGLDVRVMIPFHSIIKKKYGGKTAHLVDFWIHLGWRSQYVGIESLVADGVTYYFVDNEYYFGGPIYKGGEAEGEQYAFFQRAMLEALPKIGFIPDVIHANDWQTGMVPMLIKTQYQKTELKDIKTIFTIHNMMYQGTYPFGTVRDWLGIDPSYYHSDCLEAYGCANFMKAALVFADKINTVSPSYADEIKTAYYAYGMEGILNARSSDLCGILNGIDVDAFNPETDKYLKYHFSLSDMNGKYENKKALMRELGLTVDPVSLHRRALILSCACSTRSCRRRSPLFCLAQATRCTKAFSAEWRPRTRAASAHTLRMTTRSPTRFMRQAICSLCRRNLSPVVFLR